MGTKKQLTTKDVKNVAVLLMKMNGNTTTLEVKTELRENNYFATQEDVSEAMMELSEDLSWYFHDNGTFRTYFLTNADLEVFLSELDEDEDDELDDNNLDDLDLDDDCDDDDCDCNKKGKLKVNYYSQPTATQSNVTYTNDYHIKRDGTKISTIDPKNVRKHDWRVSSPLTTKILYFDGNLSRDEVRYAFYKICGLQKNANYNAERIS